MDIGLAIGAFLCLLALATAGVSLYLHLKAGSTADLHVRVTGLRTEVSALADHLDRLDRRERVRAVRDGQERARQRDQAAAEEPAAAPQGASNAQIKTQLRRSMLAARIPGANGSEQ